jgi:hypothetical protein
MDRPKRPPLLMCHEPGFEPMAEAMKRLDLTRIVQGTLKASDSNTLCVLSVYNLLEVSWVVKAVAMLAPAADVAIERGEGEWLVFFTPGGQQVEAFERDIVKREIQTLNDGGYQ